MAIKGHTRIELKDVNTGEVQVVEDDNMVTNALTYLTRILVRMNLPMDRIMPIATNALGGIMLFDGEIKEDPDNIYFPGPEAHLVAYGDRGTDTSNNHKGSFNSAESGPTDTGYVSVWDFGTSQANGTIRSVALTNVEAGQDPCVWQTKHERSVERNGFNDQDNSWYPIAYLDDYVYMEKWPANNRYKIAKVYIPVEKQGVAEYASRDDGRLTGETVVDVEHDPFVDKRWYYGNYQTTGYEGLKRGDYTNVYPQFFKDGHDGKFYSVMFTDNLMYMFTVNYADRKFAETKTQVVEFDKNISFLSNISESGWHSTDSNDCYTKPWYRDSYTSDRYTLTWTVANGFFYVLKSDKRSVYCININNTADIREYIVFAKDSRDYIDYIYPVAGRNGVIYMACVRYNDDGSNYRQVNLLYQDGIMFMQNVSTKELTNFYFRNENSTQYKYDAANARGNKLECWSGYNDFSNFGFKYSDVGLYYDINYLGTINNLPSAITKNSSQTMKIIYTLTDQEAGS